MRTTLILGDKFRRSLGEERGSFSEKNIASFCVDEGAIEPSYNHGNGEQKDEMR